MTNPDDMAREPRSRSVRRRGSSQGRATDLAERDQLAHAIATARLASDAAARILRSAQAQAQAEVKTFPGDLVSAADRAAETAIVRVINKRRPADAILSEEAGLRARKSGPLWVVDPIDGTSNFLRGAAPWAISIALVDEEGPLVGVVTIPPWRQQYSAVRGQGSWVNGVELRRSAAVVPEGAVVSTGLSYRPALRSRWLRALAPVLEHVADIRRSGFCGIRPLRCRRWPDGSKRGIGSVGVGCGGRSSDRRRGWLLGLVAGATRRRGRARRVSGA